MCLCETKYQGGVSHHFGGVLTSLTKYRDIRYRSDTIAISRDMGQVRHCWCILLDPIRHILELCCSVCDADVP